MSDDCMTYRIVVKEYAMKYGWHATFMPKPLFGENGSGMHVHQSLTKDGKERLLRRRRPVLPLATAKAFIAGQLQPRARDLTALRPVGQLLQAPRPGYEAPVYLAWSRRNRSALIRVPLYHPGKEGATRAELRCPTRPATLPLLRRHAAGGPRGDREGLRAARADGAEPLPPLARGARPAGDRAAAGDARRGDRGRRRLGAGLRTLGEHTFRRFIEIKRQEWDEYRSR
jgi:glutamine synthetase